MQYLLNNAILVLDKLNRKKRKEETLLKVMLDSNVYDELINSPEVVKEIGAKCEVYITAVQHNELRKVSDIYKREKIDNLIKVLSPVQVSVPFSFSNLCFSHMDFGPGEYTKDIEGNSRQMTNDSLIGDAAIENECILVSKDKGLVGKMLKLGHSAMQYDDFIDELMKV